MTRIGCRAHDYGKLPAAALAATLRAKGYNAAQLLRDEVILPADTADVRYLRRMTDTV